MFTLKPHALPPHGEPRAASAKSLVRNKTEAELSFLLGLTDRLQVLSDPLTIQLVACRSLGAHLAVTRELYADVLNGRNWSSTRNTRPGQRRSHLVIRR